MLLEIEASWRDLEGQETVESCSVADSQITGSRFSVPYSLEDGRLCIFMQKLTENDCRLMKLSVVNPAMAGRDGDGGSTFVPSGCGALLHHEGHEPAEHVMQVFYPCGSDADISLFGCQEKTGRGVAATVIDGRFDMTLRIRTNWGEQHVYTVFPDFEIREYPDEMPYAGNIVIVYHAITQGWVEAAKCYRDVMAEAGSIKTLKEKIKTNKVVEKSSRSLCVRFRMGVRPLQDKVDDPDTPNTAPINVYMTFSDVRRVADEFARQGIQDAEFCLVGWNLGGHDGAYPQLFPVEEAFGGEDELKKTITYCQQKGYPLSLHDNYFDCYSVAGNYNHDTVQVTHEGGDLLGGIWGAGQARQMCASQAHKHYAETNMSEVKERLNPQGTYYIDVLTVAQLTKCYSSDHPMTREENAKWWKKTLRVAHDTFGSISSEGARDWALPELDRAFSLAGSDGLPEYLDEEIPLVPVVWHGYLLYNTYRGAINKKSGDRLFLKNLAYGGIPLLYFHQIFTRRLTKSEGWDEDLLCSKDPSDLSATVKAIKDIDDIYAKVKGLSTERISNFIRHSETLTETVFENGASLWTNYSNEDQTTPNGDVIAGNAVGII